MLFTPEQFIVLGLVLLGGLLIGYACAPNPRKWKRRAREQSKSFTAHYKALDEQLRTTNQRVADLETEAGRLRADHVEAERTIGTLRAAAMAAPATPVAEEIAHRPALTSVGPEPVAEAEWTPVDVERQPVETQAGTATAPIAGAVLTEPVVEPTETVPAPAAVDSFPEPVIVAPMTPFATDAPPAPIGPAEPEMPSKGWFAGIARDDLTRIRGIDGVLNARLFSLGVVRFEDLEKLSAEDEMALEQRLALPVGYIAREQWRTQSALLRAGQTEEHAAHFGAAEAVTVG